jgi:hypothetical protein
VLGSVEFVNGQYILNARLVEIETGNVLSTGYEEMPAEVFDEEAKSYLKLVPDTQVIGLYAFYNYGFESDSLPPYTLSTGETITPQSKTLNMPGVGLKYFPRPNLVIDAAYLFFPSSFRVGQQTAGYGPQEIDFYSYSVFRGFVALNQPWGSSSSWQVGGGAIKYHAVGTGSSGSAKIDKVAPFIRAGAEWRVQQRLGIGLYANYLLSKVEGKYDGSSQPFYRANPLTIEPTLSIYF